MAAISRNFLAIIFLCIFSLLPISLAGRTLTNNERQPTVEDPSTSLLQYHRGPLLAGKISVNLIWYGRFTAAQRAIVSDFLTSLSSSNHHPSVATWWSSIGKYYHLANKKSPSFSLSLDNQLSDDTYSLGHTLTGKHLVELAATAPHLNAINVVLTSSDVAVEGFCSSRCGTHGSSYGPTMANGKRPKFAYIWVGNSETQCPGQCAWPFHQPIYGPQSPPLASPNNDVGLDGMVINLASLLAGTATNPFGDGFFQGPKEAPLEAASACLGVYGKGAYPGYAGNLLVDETSGASYNANGINGRRYLLPALYDPSTSTCSTLV